MLCVQRVGIRGFHSPSSICAAWTRTYVFALSEADSSSSRRIGKQAFSRCLDDGYCLLPWDGWEIFDEVFERRASSEVVEEALNWHSSAGEAKRSAHDFGITTNEGCIHACLQ